MGVCARRLPSAIAHTCMQRVGDVGSGCVRVDCHLRLRICSEWVPLGVGACEWVRRPLRQCALVTATSDCAYAARGCCECCVRGCRCESCLSVGSSKTRSGLTAETVRLKTITGNLVNMSKSSLRGAPRSRATATDRCVCAAGAGSPVCPALARAWAGGGAVCGVARTLAGAAVRRGWTYQSPGRTARATGPGHV